MDSRTKARRGLAIFFVVLIAGTAYIEHKILVLGSDIGQRLNLIYALMWWVTAASVVARLIIRESPRDVSFGWGGWAGTRAILVATPTHRRTRGLRRREEQRVGEIRSAESDTPVSRR